jgi:phosphatidylserine synthase
MREDGRVITVGYILEPVANGVADAGKTRCYNPRLMNTERLIRYTATLLIVFLGIGYALFTFPANKQDTSRLLDFSEFYAAGQIVRHGLGSSLYDLIVQAEFQLQVAPVHAFYLRPPFEALLFVPFTYLSYRAAYAAWVIFSLALLSGAARLIQRNTNILDAMSQYTRGIPVDYGLLLVVFLTFAPTMNCFLIGQDSVLMLMIYTLVFLALKRGRELEAGGVLACGLFKFHLVLPFAIIFALRRRGAFLLGFAGIALLLVAISALVSGPGILVGYPKMFLNSQYRALMGFRPEYAANIHGLLYLITPANIPVAIPGAVVAALSGFLLWVTARIWKDNEFDLCFSTAVVATLLTGYHAFVYDLSLLLLPVAIVCGELAKRKILLGNLALNCTLVVLFVQPIHYVLMTHHIYAVMCLPVMALFVSVARIAAPQLAAP